MSDSVRHVVEFSAGALVRGRIVAELRRGALLYGVELQLEEARGWLESDYTCAVTGEAAAVQAYLGAVTDYVCSLGR